MPSNINQIDRLIRTKFIPELAKLTLRSIYIQTPVLTGNLRSTLRIVNSENNTEVLIGGKFGRTGHFVDYAREVEERRNYFFSSARNSLNSNVRQALQRSGLTR